MEEHRNVRVPPEKLVAVAGLAATNVAGVAHLAVPWPGRLRQLIRRERPDDAVRIHANDAGISVEVDIVVRDGADLLDVAARVRQEVASAVASASGTTVRNVGVHIQDVE